MGRPTDNPKIRNLTIRLDEDSSAILGVYCQQEALSESEAVRRGIKKLANDIKEEK